MKTKLFLPFFLFSFYFSISQTGALKGLVKTLAHKPLAFANIGLKGTVFGTQTKENGEFVLKSIMAGNYTLVVSFQGLQNVELPVEIKVNETTSVKDILIGESEIKLNEVQITGVQNQNELPVYVGKSDIKPMDLPQSVAVLDKTQLEQQQTLTMSDALKNFNGVYLMGTTGGAQQEIAARGFAFSSSNTFKNGVRYNNSVLPEMSSLERVEVLKGSAAILFGNVSAGGVINLVTKKPIYTSGGEISLRMDSYQFYKPCIDVYGVIGEKAKAAYRMNMSYEKGNSFRNTVSSDRVYMNPSLSVKLTKKTELLIEGDYLRDNRTSDFGIGSINYALVDIPRDRFLGAKWSYYNSEQKSITTTLTHRFNSKWQLKSSSSIQAFKNDLFGTARPNANNQFIRSNGNWVRGLQRIGIDEEYYITQLDLTGRFTTGSIKHQLLVGGDMDYYSTLNTTYNTLNKYDSINVFNLDLYKQRSDIPELTRRILTKTPIQRAGVYAQDLIELSKHLKVLAGLRGSYIETASRVLTFASNSMTYSKQYDFAVTPRVGLVFQPKPQLSLFGSYANSFNPNSGVDVNGSALKPSYINQYEGGLKSMLFKNLLSANLTAYQIVNSNLAQTSLVNGNSNTNIKELAGEVTSRGLELDIASKSILGFVLTAGYSYNQTKYTKSNTYIEGSLLRYNPNHTANTSLYYSFSRSKHLKGLTAGLSVLYFGERQAGRSTRVTVANDPYRLFTLPAYTLVDASIAYTYKQFSIRVKLTNCLNALSFNVHDDNSVNPIAPRQFACNLSYKF